MAVVDSVANVMASLDALQTALYNGQLTSISFTDASPQVTLTAAELVNDVRVIGVMQGNFAVSARPPRRRWKRPMLQPWPLISPPPSRFRMMGGTDFSQSAEFLGDVSITSQHPADAQHWLALI